MMSFVFAWGCVLLITMFDHGQSLKLYLQAAPTKTWEEAFNECKSRGMQLAILNSEADYNGATSYIETSNPVLNNIWIGYRLINVTNPTYGWINGETTKFCPWGPNDPDYIASDSCVRLLQYHPFKFADKECSFSCAFLCTGVDEMTTQSEALNTTNEAIKITRETIASLTAAEANYSTTKTEETITKTFKTSTMRGYTTRETVKSTTESVYPTNEALYTTYIGVDTTYKAVINNQTVNTTAEAIDTTNGTADTTSEAVNPFIYAERVDTTTPGVESTTSQVFNTIAEVAYPSSNLNTTTESFYNISKDNNGCTCICDSGNIKIPKNYNYTFVELKKIMSPVTDSLRQDLLVDKTTLSAYINKRISQKDDRPSAQHLGYVGVTFLILIVVLIVLADLTSWCKA